jgi:hypothetical protein
MSRLVVDDHEEIKRMDRELDMEVILQWRWCASIFVLSTSVHTMGIILQILSEKAGSSIPWWSVPEIPKRVWCRVWGGCQSFAFTNSYRVPLGLQKKFTLLHCFFHLLSCPFPWKTVNVHYSDIGSAFEITMTSLHPHLPPSAFDIHSAHTLSFLTNNSDMHTYFS